MLKNKRLDCVTIYASPNGNVAFDTVLEVAMRDNLVQFPS